MTPQDSKEHKFSEAVKDSHLEQHVEKPTHVVKLKQPSLLDLLLTDKSLELLKIDHTPLWDTQTMLQYRQR